MLLEEQQRHRRMGLCHLPACDLGCDLQPLSASVCLFFSSPIKDMFHGQALNSSFCSFVCFVCLHVLLSSLLPRTTNSFEGSFSFLVNHQHEPSPNCLHLGLKYVLLDFLHPILLFCHWFPTGFCLFLCCISPRRMNFSQLQLLYLYKEVPIGLLGVKCLENVQYSDHRVTTRTGIIFFFLMVYIKLVRIQ